MPRPLARPRSDQEKAGRGPAQLRGIITGPARPLPGGTPDHVVEKLREHMDASREHLDKIAKLLAAQGGPGVLETATVTIPAQAQEQGFEPGAPGVFTQDRYRVPYAAVVVVNPGAIALTVTSGPPQGSAPGGGQGQFTVPANSFVAMNLAGSSLSVYGPPGAVFSYSVLTGKIQPMAAQLGPPSPVTAQAQAAAGGNATATLPAGAAITGFTVTAALGGATATTAVVTVTGALGGTLTYQVAIPANGASIPLAIEFPQPLPPAAAGGQIAVTWTGNVNTPAASIAVTGAAA